MTRRDHIRRVGILCCHCLRNMSFYMAGWREGDFIFKEPSQFWINVNANFLDVCVLEWCKLFADKKNGKHYWGKVTTDEVAFIDGLLKALRITNDEFEVYVKEMRSYRDKFIAHLDLEERMHIPKLHVAHQSTAYLYDYLRSHEDKGGFFIDFPDTALSFYMRFLNEGKLVYRENE
ncbi:MAG: hypothetical protein Q7O12_03925 [Deltaproteobacteria bacterium]|nr:hypothetical protein [Deltaproteobacteria bacterium]